MVKLTNILLFILIVILSYLAYNLYLDLPLETKNFSISPNQDLPEVVGVSSNLVQFAPNMRFATTNLSFYFQSECDSERREFTKKALKMISDKTGIISFYELNYLDEEVHILVKCSEESKEKISEDKNQRTFIAGEGGPTKYLELNPYSLVIQGEIQLYGSEYITKCSQPLVELHELLHVFGFDHIDDKTSILYPHLSCDQEFKQNIIDDLKKLYKEPAKAELLISNISASKSGKYLDFYIGIKNTGLIESNNVFLEIYSKDTLIKSTEVLDISPGMMRSIEMKNLELPSRNTENIKFLVKSSTPEYSLENNFIELVLKA
jgi:hypothetical protein